MEGQISIFDLIESMKANPEEWEHFRDNYCKHQMGRMRFDNEGNKTDDKAFDVVAGCCYKNVRDSQGWQDWGPCTFESCPFIHQKKCPWIEKCATYGKGCKGLTWWCGREGDGE